jgi:hypothetical protein
VKKVSFLTVLLLATCTLARPEYAAREGVDCVHCHLNPRGGGPRNERGAYYETHGHGFEGWGGETEIEQPPVGASPVYLIKSVLAVLTTALSIVVFIAVYRFRANAREKRDEKAEAWRKTHRRLGWTLIVGYTTLTVICLVTFGVGWHTTRVLIHSVVGFLGLLLFAVKVTVVRKRWKLWKACHFVGGSLLIVNLVMFATSAWWYLFGRFI